MTIISNQKLKEELDILSHVEALAFDRSAASVGETKAINYIQEELNLGEIESRAEYFSWNTPINLLMKTIYLMAIGYLLVFRLFLIIVLFFFISYMFQRKRRISLVKKEESKNVIAKISAKKNKTSSPIIIFTAHYDSVSSRVPYKVQRILLVIIKLIIFPYIGLSIFISIWLTLNILKVTYLNNFIIYLISILSLVTLSVLIPIFLFIFTSNKSAGSIDNASGVSILIELSKIIKNQPLNNFEVFFIWCGAEEWGLKGSRKFCKRHYKDFKKQYNLERSININIDMVGSYIGLLDKTGLILKKSTNTELNDILQASANKLDIPLDRFDKIFRPKSDYRSFRIFRRGTKKKFQIACFHSDKDSKYIHSKSDTPDKCSNKNLNGCLEICYDAISYLDSHFN